VRYKNKSMAKFISTLLLCFTFIYCTNQDHKHISIPDIKGKKLNGDSLSLKAIVQNKMTLVNVWGIFCGPCIKELPLLHKVYDKYKSREDFGFITLAMDSEKEFQQFLNSVDTSNPYRKMFIHSKLKDFYLPTLTCLPNGYSNIYGGYAIIKDSTQCRSIQKQIQSNAIPTTLIYDKEGNQVFKQIGSFENEKNLTDKIDSLLSIQ
jgi:thiol-disulfide isomerase/thioredoxin